MFFCYLKSNLKRQCQSILVTLFPHFSVPLGFIIIGLNPDLSLIELMGLNTSRFSAFCNSIFVGNWLQNLQP